jgi:hypothetical protein
MLFHRQNSCVPRGKRRTGLVGAQGRGVGPHSKNILCISVQILKQIKNLYLFSQFLMAFRVGNQSLLSYLKFSFSFFQICLVQEAL